MEAVDLQAKQMKEQSLELKKEGPLFVHKVVQKSPFKSPKKSTKWSGNGRTISVIKRGIMVVINVAQLGK